MAEFSFDVVAKIERQELSNAIDLAKKEIDTRFDFKGSKTEIKLEKDILSLEASDDMKMRQLIDVLQNKFIKRELNIKAFKFGEFETNVSGTVKCRVEIQNGLSQDQSKKIIKLIKDSKLKIQSRIEGEKIRITGKSKDDLQTVQKMIKDANYDFAASFENYR
ncbi:MAG: YajQ family cyclic di-GMP-binding protein [Spirochaetia bacterium]|nr:YajQ family cyclic di-GMP-binding protein [Spirochaetia bacterium]